MDYSKLSDMQINAAVAICIWDTDMTAKSGEFDPCNNAADAWPIIVASKIGIVPAMNGLKWSANHGSWDIFYADKNPLRAAMIVYLMMQESE